MRLVSKEVSMKKLLLILPFLLMTTLIFAFEGGRWGATTSSTAAGVGDTADAVRGDIRDTTNAWWGDTSAIYSTVVALEDSTDAAREDGGDSAAAYADLVRADIPDSIVVFADTMEANPVLINDLQAIDSLQVPLWSTTPATGASGMFGMDSVGDTLWGYFPGGKVAVYPQEAANAMSQSDIVDTLNNATVSITQTWEWDGGNIIAADGQKVIVTDDAEDDTLQSYIINDSAFINATGIPLVLGEEGMTIMDSVEVLGNITGNFKVRDTLIVPTYAAVPATGSEGLFAADSANDSLIAYWGAARRVIYPSAGATGGDIADSIHAQIYCVNFSYTFYDFLTCSKNSTGEWVSCPMRTTFAADTLYIDSLWCLIYADADSNEVDSCYIKIDKSMTTSPQTLIWQNNDVKGLDAGYQKLTYTGINTKVAVWDLWTVGFKCDKTAASSDVRCYNYVWWLHDPD
jgi:hypothetical protein